MLELTVNNLPVPVKVMTFSGGEQQVAIDMKFMPKSDIGFIKIKALIKSSADLMTLLLLKDALDRLPRKTKECVQELYLPYIPYARQDRVMNPGESLGVAVLAKVINSMHFDAVTVEDPHSDVAPALFDNLIRIEQHTLVGKYLNHYIRKNNILICSPDAGAMKKVGKLADKLGIKETITGMKHRDTVTGEITGTNFVGPDVWGRNVLIVDDILDGGWTFIKLGEALRAAGAKRVDLWVTHGIFSKGVEPFVGVIDTIFTRNVWEENIVDHDKYKVELIVTDEDRLHGYTGIDYP